MTTITEHQPDLLAEFPADEIGHRPGGRGMTFSYIEARQVMDRLDQTVGPDNWADDYEPFGDPAKGAVKCSLTVCGVTKRGIGYPNSDGDQEPYKSAESDALKRAAVKVGIGRFLYPTAGGKSRTEEGNSRTAESTQRAETPSQSRQSSRGNPASQKQIEYIQAIAEGMWLTVETQGMSSVEASAILDGLKGEGASKGKEFRHPRLKPAATQTPDVNEHPTNVDQDREIHQAPPQGRNQTTQTPQSNGPKPASANQLATIKKLSGLLGVEVPADIDAWGRGEASSLVSELSAEYNARRGGAKRMQPA